MLTWELGIALMLVTINHCTTLCTLYHVVMHGASVSVLYHMRPNLLSRTIKYPYDSHLSSVFA